MKTTLGCIFIVSILLASFFKGHASPPNDDAPPYAISNDTSAVLFGEGVISTPDDEFGGIFIDGGKTCFFSKSVPRFYLETICESKFKNGKWNAPEIAQFSGQYRSFDPSVSPDGNTILFTSDRPVHGENKKDFDIWIIKKTANGWSEPMRLDSPLNSSYDEHFASMAANGTIYFSSNRPGAVGGEGDADVYRCKLVNGKYSDVEHLNDSINSSSYVLDVTIAADESFLLLGYFGQPDGFGLYDIYISKQVNGNWTAIKNIGPKVNTKFRDYSPRVSPDGQYLFFTSEKDWSAVKRDAPYTYEEVTDNFQSILNGSGNIYEIKLTALGIKPPVINALQKK